ncbi:MAG: glutamate 5-kinase [Planctomycetota bacterium]
MNPTSSGDSRGGSANPRSRTDGFDSRSDWSEIDTIVVKVGSRVLTDRQSGRLDRRRIKDLSAGLAGWADTKRQVVLVSSGAVAAGVGKLAIDRPDTLEGLQAVAAIGQADLIQAYESALAHHGRHAAQVLLTTEDLRRRSGYLNVRNALSAIHRFGAIAIVNENDSVAVAELMTTFGDNDSLAARVAGLFPAALLVILSDVDGLYDGPPDAPGSRKIDLVKGINDSIRQFAAPHRASESKGGMASKLAAAEIANRHGHPVIVAPGTDPHVLQKILAAETVGTLFVASSGDAAATSAKVVGRRRWIGWSARIEGRLQIDAGATEALLRRGRSLLAVGITAVEGDFSRGSVVEIVDPDGAEIARGLVNYSASEMRQIQSLPNDQISKVLGHTRDGAAVHRDNLVLLEA